MLTIKTYFKPFIAISFCLFLLLTIPLTGQNNIDYIPDWYRIFFSQNDLISFNRQFYFDENEIYNDEKINFRTLFTLNDFYREKSENLNRKVYYWQQFNELIIPVKILGHRFLFNTYSQFVSKEIDYDINSIEYFKMAHNSKKYFLSVSVPVWNNYLLLSAGAGTRIQNSNTNFNYHIGIQFLFNTETALSFFSYSDFFKWIYEIGFQEPEIIIYIPENSQMNELLFQTRIIQNLTLSALMQNNHINQKQTIENNKTSFLPTGIRYRRQLKFEYNIRDFLIFEFAYSSHENDLSGRFYELKQSFGKITESIDFNEKYSPGVSYVFDQHTFGVNFTIGKGYLYNRGHIESWPFTTTWIDLLGLRYNFNSRIEYNFNRYVIKYKFSNPDWAFALSSSYEILKPSGETRTWEPGFLVFGIQNLKIYDFKYSLQNGIYFMLDLSKKLSDAIKIQYQFSQYVPVTSEKDEKINNGLTTERKKNGHIYGGGKHQIYFSFYF